MQLVVKSFWTWRKVVSFLFIIGLGVLGLIFADQNDFLNGRTNDQTSIGDGIADPLVTEIKINNKQSTSGKAEVSGIDGTRKIPCKGKTC